MTRLPVVAGQFYEGTEELLRKRIEDSFLGRLGPGKLPEGESSNPRSLKGLIVPHAGYVYSGMPAAHGYLRLFEDGYPDHLVIIGPNHTGFGERVAICNDDWQTPLGIIRYDTELGPAIVEKNPYANNDCVAHSNEHSIEVQIPFLQYVFGNDISFVPISLRDQSFEVCKSLANTLIDLSEEMDILVLASSDFTHFLTSDDARKMDNQAMEFLEMFDPEGFLRFVQRKRVSICGAGPIATSMLYAMDKGATSFNVLKYTNSGDITGDNSRVVSYVSATII